MPPTDDELIEFARQARVHAGYQASLNAAIAPDPPRARADSFLQNMSRFPLPIWDSTTRDMAEMRVRQDQVASSVQRAPALGPYLADPRNYALAADDLHPLSRVAESARALPQRRGQYPYLLSTSPRSFMGAIDRPDPISGVIAASPGRYGGAGFPGLARFTDGATPMRAPTIGMGPYAPTELRAYRLRNPDPIDAVVRIIASAGNLAGQGLAGAGEALYDVFTLRAFGLDPRQDIEDELRRQGRNPDDFVRSSLHNIRDYYRQSLPQIQFRTGNEYIDAAIGGLESVPIQLTAIGAAATGNPGAALAMMATVTGGQAYSEARDAGLSPGRALVYAGIQGGLEAAGEMLPVFRFADDAARGSGLLRTLGGQLLTEIPGEQFTQHAQDFETWAAIEANQGKTLQDYLAERPRVARDTLIATIAAVGMQTTAGHVVARAARRASVAGASAAEDRALDALMSASAESRLRRESPADFSRLLEHLTGGNESIYVPAAQVRALFQTPEEMAADTFWGDYVPQINEAEALHGDVVVPLSAAATHLAGSPQWEALKDHVRTSAGGMSRAEAVEAEHAFFDAMQESGQQLADEMRAEQERMAPVEKVHEAMRDKLLHAGFRLDVANQLAQQFSQRQRVRADRLGRPLTGTEADAVDVRQVLPQNLARAISAENVPDAGLRSVIAAMRKGATPRSDRARLGPSLVEFLAKRGGIEDIGGELKHMGFATLGQRLKKKGPTKLIRQRSANAPTDADGRPMQESMDHSFERALEAAIDAGYFPNLDARNMAEIDSVSTVDTGPLLDAIRDELHGKPRYAETNDSSTEADNMRMAAQELYALLDQQGIDPEKATEAEIVRTVSQYQAERSAGRGYDQVDIRSAAFKKWFGDSKVVDKNGEPLVVYHGAPDARGIVGDDGAFKSVEERFGGEAQDGAHWFTPSRSTAATYADEHRAFDYQNAEPAIVPVYLKIENPLVIDAAGKEWREAQARGKTKDVIDEAREAGHDGVIIRNVRDDYNNGPKTKPTDTYLVFKSTQIKSVNNVGTFDPADPRILHQPAYHGSPPVGERGITLFHGSNQNDLTLEGVNTDRLATKQNKKGRTYGGFYATATLEEAQGYAGENGSVYSVTLKPDARVETTDRDVTRLSQADRDALRARGVDVLVGKDPRGRTEHIIINKDAIQEFQRRGEHKKEAPIVRFRKDAAVVMAALPPVATGFTRLWRGERVGADGSGLKFTNDLAGIALPFREAYGGNLNYVDIPTEDVTKYEETGAVAPGAEFQLPPDLASKAQVYSPVQSYEQSFSDGPRGRITFGNGKAVIDLFEARDLSTLIHETGHLYLEELKADAEIGRQMDTPEGQQLAADFDTVTAWFAKEGHPIADDGTIPTEAHEMFARGFERYAMEGKAPSSGLKRAFEAFRSWLLNIYKNVAALRAPITPEIRDVMARMMATDEEIASAQVEQAIKLGFTSAKDAGMTDAEFKAYQNEAASATSEAHDALLKKVMATVRAARTKEYRDQEREVRAEIATAIDQQPIFRALSMLRGKDANLDKQFLIDSYGSLGMFPPSVPPIYSDKNTVHPDVVAEETGFSSGDEMIRALMDHEAVRKEMRANGDKRSPRQVQIDEGTAKVMAEQYGDPLKDGTIEEEARAIIHNEKQGEVFAAELRALSRTTGKRPTPYRIAREWANERIAAGQVQSVASGAAIQNYLRAAAKAGREFEQALAKGDRDAAFKHKQAQMLNNALVAAAKEAKDRVDVAVRRLGKLAKTKTRASMDQGYLDQIHALLEQVEMRTRSQASLDEQQSYEAWADEQRRAGVDLVKEPSFAASLGKTHWSRLSVEQLIGLDDTVQQIAHLGRLKQTLLDGQERRQFEEIIAEAENAAGLLPPKPPSDLMEPSFGERLKGKVASFDAALLKMETVIDWLDSKKSAGVFNRIVFKPIADAQTRAADMFAEYMGKLNEALGQVPKKMLRRWGDRVTPPELLNRKTGNPYTMTRQQLVSMALNMGNEGNAQRLADGYGWNEDAIMAVLNRELSAEEWNYVQSVWDIIDGLWPHIEAMEKTINGVAPEKVEARPLETSAGSLKGGYFPAVYDSSKDYAAERNAGRESDLFETTYTRATTRASATKDRSEKVSRPILLNLGVITRHIGELTHDIAYREAVMNADKFLLHPRIMAAVDSTLGPEIRKQFRPWLKFVANQWAMERAGNEGIGAFMNKLRTNTTVVGMGYRFSTMLMQLAGYSNSFEAVGFKWVSAAVAQTSAHPIETFKFVMDRSGEMRHRMDTLDRDIDQGIRRLAGKTNPLTEAKRFAYHGIGYMDRVVVIPTWIGAYNKALASGATENEAIYAGDKAVRQSQGAGAAKDMAAVQRGTGKWGEALKLTTMFYSYLSAVWQRQRTLGRDVRNANPADLPGIAARAWWLIVLPPVLSELMGGRGPDDDDDWTAWAFKQMLFQMIGAIPVARDIARPAWDKAVGNKAFDYQLSPVQRAGQSAVNVAGDLGRIVRGEDTAHATRDTLEALGYWTGLVPGQFASATQFLVDVGSGEAEPEGVGDWYEGLTKGRLHQAH